MLLDSEDKFDTTGSTEFSIVHVIDFPFWANCGVPPFSTHMNIRGLSTVQEAIKTLAFHRVIALLRTDRDNEQKLVLTRDLHCPVEVSRFGSLGHSQSIHCSLSSLLLAQHGALKLPNTQ